MADLSRRGFLLGGVAAGAAAAAAPALAAELIEPVKTAAEVRSQAALAWRGIPIRCVENITQAEASIRNLLTQTNGLMAELLYGDDAPEPTFGLRPGLPVVKWSAIRAP